MSYETILLEKKDMIAKIILNQPEKRNPLGIKTINEINGAIENCRDDKDIRVIIVTGAGDKAFCAGADISDFKTRSIPEYRAQYDAFVNLNKTFGKVGKPIIAMVNGYALAGGCGLAMLCDISIASDRAKLGLTEINVGVFPMMVMAILFRVVGRKKGLELIMTGDIIDAEEARRIGIINRVVPHEELEERTMELATKLKNKSPVVLKLGRDACYTMFDMSYEKALEYAKEMVTLVSCTEDAQEGVKAFFEKREPIWKGR